MLIVDRVRWFRTRAALDRRREELEILNEEFHRTACSFTQMSNIWMKLGDEQLVQRKDNSLLGNGYHAFAYRQAAMYSRLAQGALENWNAARPLTP